MVCSAPQHASFQQHRCLCKCTARNQQKRVKGLVEWRFNKRLHILWRRNDKKTFFGHAIVTHHIVVKRHRCIQPYGKNENNYFKTNILYRVAVQNSSIVIYDLLYFSSRAIRIFTKYDTFGLADGRQYDKSVTWHVLKMHQKLCKQSTFNKQYLFVVNSDNFSPKN